VRTRLGPFALMAALTAEVLDKVGLAWCGIKFALNAQAIAVVLDLVQPARVCGTFVHASDNGILIVRKFLMFLIALVIAAGAFAKQTEPLMGKAICLADDKRSAVQPSGS
jgi:hypothetical protein